MEEVLYSDLYDNLVTVLEKASKQYELYVGNGRTIHDYPSKKQDCRIMLRYLLKEINSDYEPNDRCDKAYIETKSCIYAFVTWVGTQISVS